MRSPYSVLFPECEVDGFSRSNIALIFYSFINSVVEDDHVVVDLGAGRGAFVESTSSRYLKKLAVFKGRCAKIIGLDVDPIVLENPLVDEAKIFKVGEPLPLDDNSVDVVFSDWVLEHVEHPDKFIAEVNRILKPGGWFCARTPNRWGMIGLAKALIPEKLESWILSKLQPNRQEHDVFPTFYRMNSVGQIGQAFSKSQWNNHTFCDGYEVGYFTRSPILIWFGYLYHKLMPKRLGLVLFVFTQKK